MVVGVHPDLVALRRHPPHQVLVARDAVAQEEEGGGHLPQGQLVQQPPGGGGARPVVKGEGHHRHAGLFRPPPPPGRGAEAGETVSGTEAGTASIKHTTNKTQLTQGAPLSRTHSTPAHRSFPFVSM